MEIFISELMWEKACRAYYKKTRSLFSSNQINKEYNIIIRHNVSGICDDYVVEFATEADRTLFLLRFS
jgi:hypothetical protein